jgi:MFS transporter, DHA2 family, multidrug resistance protein
MSPAQETPMNDLAQGEWKPGHSPYLITFTVMLATFMEVLDTSIANVALPHIAGNLSAGVDESTWVLTSYLVSNAIVLPMSGWFSSLFGRKRFYITCVALFTIASFLCGVAPNLGSLIFFRIIQGAGGGAMQPLAQAILIESFPRSKRGMAMALYGMGVVVAPIIGPTLGGWITDSYSWRWIFFINIPIGILSIIMTGGIIKDPPYLVRKSFGSGFRVDFIGLGLIALGLGALQIVLDKGERLDWFASNFITIFAAISFICLTAVVFWELRQEHPIVQIHMLFERNFATSVFLIFVTGFVLYGSLVLLPIYVQSLMGYNALLSGLIISPGGAVVLVMMPFIGMLTSRVQPRWLVITGLIIGAIGTFYMASFNLEVNFGYIVLARCIQSASLGLLFIPINTAAYSLLARDQFDQAAGLINLARNIGGSVGISFVATMLSRRAQFHQSVLSEHANEFNPLYQQMFGQAKAAIMHQGSSAYEATVQANAFVYQLILRQASMLSFIDCFWLLSVLFLASIPFVFLLKKVHHGDKHDVPAGH